MKTLCSMIAASTVLMSCTGPVYASMHQGPYALVVINTVTQDLVQLGVADVNECQAEALNVRAWIKAQPALPQWVEVRCVPIKEL